MAILFFEAIARPALWGKTLVRDYFGYHEMPFGTGQTWAFSCDEKGSNVCQSDPYRGMTLSEIWRDHQELFGREGKPFPVIISLVGPEESLSVQVHPDTPLAKKLGFPFGKNEAWYFLECPEDANIIFGHIATDEKEFCKMAEEDRWDELLIHYPVKAGDFVYTPAGVVHAVGKGCVTYEIQQATDVTYRLYDFHRIDRNGKERQLDVEKGMECVKYDPALWANEVHPVTEKLKNGERTIFISNDSFTVSRLNVHGECSFCDENYQLATVVAGMGKADGITVKIGDSFLIPQKEKVQFSGNMTVMMTRN